MAKEMRRKLLATLMTLAMAFSLLPAVTLQAKAAMGDTWIDQTAVNSAATEGYSLESVCYGGSTYVAVGQNGKIVTSSDGATWTSRISGTSLYLSDVCTNGSGTFVAVAGGNITPGGVILTSTNSGATWSSQPFNAYYASVCYGNGMFMAFADGDCYTSFDGSNWTEQYYVDGNPVYGMAFGGANTYVAVGFPDYIDDYYLQIKSSTSLGTSWSKDLSFWGIDNLYAVCYGGSKFVVVGDSGIVLTSGTGAVGSWSQHTIPDNTLQGVCYTGDNYIAVGYNFLTFNAAIYSSADGISWASITPSTTNRLYGVCYGSNMLVAVGANGTIITSGGNAAPTIANLNGDSINFTEDGSNVLLDNGSNATVTDSDNANFNGGNLTVSIIANLASGEDVLSIANNGTGAGQIGVSGANVTYEGITIGTFAGGTGANSLVVSFNINATPTAATALIRALTYSNTNTSDPSTSARTVRVTVSDGIGGTSANSDVTVSITAVNDAPTDMALSAASVNENVAGNTTVGALSTTDPDAGDTFTYTLVAGTGDTDNAAFNINGSSLRITNSPNYEAKSSYTVRVRTTDQGSLWYEEAYTVTIVDLSESPTDIALSASSIDENVAGNTTVGSLSSTDPDAGNTFTYTLTTGTGDTDNAAFNISGGSLRITNSPNYEAKSSYSVRVRTTDQGSLSYEEAFTITVNDLNDAPTVTNSTKTVIEDTTMTFAAADFTGNYSDQESSALSTVRIETLPDAGHGKLQLSGADITAAEIVNAADLGNITFVPALNFSGDAAFTWKASDGADYSAAAATMTLSVTGVNDAPSFTKGSDKTVLEDGGAQSFAGWATALSAGPADESGQVVSFALSNDNNGLFSAQPALASNGTLTFTPAASANGTATVTVSAHDDGGTANGGVDTSAAQTFMITVTSLNDAPSFTKGSNKTVLEDGGAQSFAGWATAISVGPANESEQVVSFIVSNDDNALFSSQPAVASNGTLTFTPAASANGTATVTISAQDDGGTANGGVDTSAAQTFMITVTSLNDAPSFTKGPDKTVDEDGGAQSFAGWATALSVGPANESGQALSFTVSSDNNDLFSAQPAVASNGTLTFTPAANASGIATVTVSAQDDGGTANGGVDTSAAQTFMITVTSLNDAPSFTKGSNKTVLEDGGAQSFAGWATAISAGPADESGQVVSFTLSSDNNGLFVTQPAVAANGTLTFTPAANANGVATVTVTAHDDGGTANGGDDTSTSQTFMITVTGVNDAPGFTKGPDKTVLEDCGAQSFAGWATALSAGPADESGQTLSFTVSNDNNDLFSAQPAVASNGTLCFTPAASANGVATVTVSIRDDGGTANGGVDASASQTFTITVTSTNDAPTVTNSTKTVAEDTTMTFSAADFTGNYSDEESSALSAVRIETLPDAGHGKLQLGGVDIEAAEMVNAADLGNITFVPVLNFSGSASFTWNASDGADYSALAATMTLNVTGVNDSPSDISLGSAIVSESAAVGTTVGTLSTTDPDAGDSFTYALVIGDGSDDNGSFSIVANALKTNTALNYATKNSYSIRVKATDAGGLIYEKALTITITEINHAPTDIALTSTSMDENLAADSTVGTLTATDANAWDTFTYALVAGVGSGDNASFNILDDALRLTGSANYEAKSSYSVRIRATDIGGLWYEEAYTITIVDLNEAPTDIALSASSVSENVAGNTTVGTLSSTDEDAGSTYTYTLVVGAGDTDNGSFNIDGSSLRITNSPNYEAKNSYSVCIRSTDPDGLWYEEAFTITISDLSEAPVITTADTVSVVEGEAAAFTAAGSDPDGSEITWSITGGADAAKFSINAGVVTFVDAPVYKTPTDADANNQYILQITASDGVLTSDKTVTVTVTQRARDTSSSTPTTPTNVAVVEVDGERYDAGQISTQTLEGSTTTTITVDDAKLNTILEQKGNNATVMLAASGTPDAVVGQLTGQTVKNMEQKEAVLEIKTETVTYTLPASQINIDTVSAQFGTQVELKDIKVNIKIAEPSADTIQIVEDTASKGNYQLIVKPVAFEITCTNGDQTVEVSRFNGFVERLIAIPDGIDPSKITTGIVLNADNTFSHVPTQIVVIDGKYYAKINSLTNSTYSVIYNPVTFSDMENHWARDAVNDMGSRMVVTGIGNGIYEPIRSITRAEFAAIIVRALGLQKGSTESAFGDVTVNDWFNGYVDTATSYSLITGYDSASFAPNDTITREQAMTILARAMKLTGLSVSLTDSEVSELLAGYTDGDTVSSYAKAGVAACIKTGVVSGTTATTISLKSYVTRAEVAVMVSRLLEKSGLI